MIPEHTPDSKVHGANMGPVWGRQDPGGPHVGPMNLAIWDYTQYCTRYGNACKNTKPNRRSHLIKCNQRHALYWHTIRTMWNGSTEMSWFNIIKTSPASLIMILNIVIITTAIAVQSSFPCRGYLCWLSIQNILLLQKSLGNWISSSPISINLQ